MRYIHYDAGGAFVSFNDIDEDRFIEYFGYNLLNEQLQTPDNYLLAPQAIALFLQFAAEKELWQFNREIFECCQEHGRLFQRYLRDVFEGVPCCRGFTAQG